MYSMFAAPLLMNHHFSSSAPKEKDEGTCLHCKYQGTGDSICLSCFRDKYNNPKKRTGDYFKLR